MKRNKRIAYLFLRFPVVSQQFLQREVAGVAAGGLDVEVHSLLPGDFSSGYVPPPGVTLRHFHWWEWPGLLWKLPRVAARDPRAALAALRHWAAYQPDTLEKHLQTLLAAVFAVCRAEDFRDRGVEHFHGAWATGPATAALLLGRLCGRPFSFGAHAYDVYRDGGDTFLIPKMAEAVFVHTTTRETLRHLEERAFPLRPTVVLARRGLPELPEIPERHREPGSVRLLTVARLVAKKGISHQIAAARRLDRQGCQFEWKIIGDGPLRTALQLELQKAGLRERVVMAGAQPPEAVRAAYAWADVLWHTGVIDPQGDRDGLPNVIPEAMAHGLPVISCAASGALEAVEDEVNGLVVDAADAGALAEAVVRLAEDPELRTRLGVAGRRWVEENFLVEKNCRILAEAFWEVRD